MSGKQKVFFLIFLIVITFAACFRADKPEANKPENSDAAKHVTNAYPLPIDVTLNGNEFLQSVLPEGKFGSKLTSAIIGEPKTFNPWVSSDNTSSTIAELMFDTLFKTDVNTGETVPNMAKSFREEDGGKTYIVTLRKGLKWSDGVEITADDVVFTWNDIILKGLGNTSLKDSVTIDGKLPKVEKIDKYTIKFSVEKTFAPFLKFIGKEIAPKHVMEKIVKKSPEEFMAFYGTNTKPSDFVVSGPFKLKEYIPAQRVVLERNPNYFTVSPSGKRLPYLDEYVFLITGDLNTSLLKFEAGEIDMVSVNGKDAARFKEKEKKSDYIVYNLGPDTGTSFLVFNMNRRKDNNGNFYVNPVKQRWFNDVNFRKAVDYAIDRESVIANILNGAGKPLFLAEPFGSVFLNTNLSNGHKRDLDEARELLKNSGFYLKDNVLYDKNGNRVQFDILTNAGNTEREAIGVMIKEDLSELGMKADFKPVEFNSLIGKIQNTFKWDAVILGFTGNPLEPHSGKNVWYSQGSLHIFDQRISENDRDLREFEKKIDEIFDKAVSTTNFDERKKLYDEYQKIIYEEAPLVYLYSPYRIIAIRKKIKNICPTILGGLIPNTSEIYDDSVE